MPSQLLPSLGKGENLQQSAQSVCPHEFVLVDVSDIFYFFCSGRGKGGVQCEASGGGGRVRFLLKIPGGGPGGGGAEGPGGCLWRIGESGGGGLDIFFRGRNVHQVVHLFMCADGISGRAEGDGPRVTDRAQSSSTPK